MRFWRAFCGTWLRESFSAYYFWVSTLVFWASTLALLELQGVQAPALLLKLLVLLKALQGVGAFDLAAVMSYLVVALFI